MICGQMSLSSDIVVSIFALSYTYNFIASCLNISYRILSNSYTFFEGSAQHNGFSCHFFINILVIKLFKISKN